MFKIFLLCMLCKFIVTTTVQSIIIFDKTDRFSQSSSLFDDSIVSITTQDGRRVPLNEIRRLQENNRYSNQSSSSSSSSYPTFSYDHYLEKSRSTPIPFFIVEDTSQRNFGEPHQRHEVIEQKLRLKGLMPENLGQSDTNHQQIFYVQGSVAYKDPSSGNYRFYRAQDNYSLRYQNSTNHPKKFNDLVVVFKTAKKAATAVGKGSKDAVRFVGKCIGKAVTKTTRFVVKVVNTIWEGTKWLAKKTFGLFFKKKNKQESSPVSSERVSTENTPSEGEALELTADNLAESDVLCVIAFQDSDPVEQEIDQRELLFEKETRQEAFVTQDIQEELTVQCDTTYQHEQKNKHLRTLLDQSFEQYLQDDTFDFFHSHRILQASQDPLFLHELGHKFLDQATQAYQAGDNEREALLIQRAESLIQTLEDAEFIRSDVSETYDDQGDFNLGSLYNNDDPYEDIFSTYRDTPLEKQLHTELMSTLRQTSESILVFDNFFAHTTAPIIFHGAAVAKCQTNPEVSFHLADFCQSMLRYTQHIVRFVAGYASGYVAAPFIDAHEWVTHPFRSAFNAAVGFLGQAALMLAQAAYAYAQDPENFKTQCDDFFLTIQNAGAFQIGFFIGGLHGADPVSKAARMKLKLLKSNHVLNAAINRQEKAADGLKQIKNRLHESKGGLQGIQQGDIDKVTQPLKTVFSKANEHKRQFANLMQVNGIEQILDKVKTYEQARNKALKLVGDMGANSVQYYGTLKTSKGYGKVVGRISADNKVRWRLDYDPKKGPHIQVEDFRAGKGKKAIKIAIPFEGDESTFISLLKHLNR